jgi:hypothetical protein
MASPRQVKSFRAPAQASSASLTQQSTALNPVEIDAARGWISIANMIGSSAEGTKRFSIAEYRVFALSSTSF